MKFFLTINNNREIHVCLSAKGESLSPGFQNTFKIKFEEVSIISLTGKIIFDDEVLFLTFVNKKGKVFNLCEFILKDVDIVILTKYFKFEFMNLTRDDYLKGRGVIVYPPSLKGQNLYQPNYKNIFTFFNLIFRIFRLKNIGTGVLRETIQKELKNL